MCSGGKPGPPDSSDLSIHLRHDVWRCGGPGQTAWAPSFVSPPCTASPFPSQVGHGILLFLAGLWLCRNAETFRFTQPSLFSARYMVVSLGCIAGNSELESKGSSKQVCGFKQLFWPCRFARLLCHLLWLYVQRLLFRWPSIFNSRYKALC